MKSIVEIIGEVVSNCSEGLIINVDDNNGGFVPVTSPNITYLFGNSDYVKEQLDSFSQANFRSGGDKFPLVVLFTPVEEDRGGSGLQSTCKLSMLIACSSHTEWDNEKRLDTSFKKILHPIYERLMKELAKSDYIKKPYNGDFRHTYSENYSYGRFGAYTDTDKKLSEPIDAIDIRNLELSINNLKCNRL